MWAYRSCPVALKGLQKSWERRVVSAAIFLMSPKKPSRSSGHPPRRIGLTSRMGFLKRLGIAAQLFQGFHRGFSRQRPMVRRFRLGQNRIGSSEDEVPMTAFRGPGCRLARGPASLACRRRIAKLDLSSRRH